MWPDRAVKSPNQCEVFRVSCAQWFYIEHTKKSVNALSCNILCSTWFIQSGVHQAAKETTLAELLTTPQRDAANRETSCLQFTTNAANR